MAQEVIEKIKRVSKTPFAIMLDCKTNSITLKGWSEIMLCISLREGWIQWRRQMNKFEVIEQLTLIKYKG